MRHWLAAWPSCPVCGLAVERGERDFFLGPILFNLVSSETVFALVMLSWGAATWPDPPWASMAVSGIVLMIAAPFVLFPFSRTMWLALDRIFRPDVAGDDAAGGPAIEPPKPRR